MSKVLISFLGVGALESSGEGSERVGLREYRPANYKINGKQESSAFVTTILTNALACDKLIVIGTMHSMWEELYRRYSEENNCFDFDLYCQIAEVAEASSASSEIDYSILGKVETAFQSDSKIILIKYGLNEEELRYNFQEVIKIEEYLEEGDELHIDITHSFRSLSMFMMTALHYLQDVSSKKLKIEGVYYGMLDVIRELGYAPIVNLKYLTDTMEWIKGAYALGEYGSGRLIGNLLEADDQEIWSKKIKQLSDAFAMNYSYDIRNQIQSLAKLDKEELTAPSSLIIPQTLRQLKNRLGKDQAESQFQLELAYWYFENHQYGSSYILLAESIVTFVCELEGNQDTDKEEVRNEAKKRILKGVYKEQNLSRRWFQTINRIRNKVAHPTIEKRKDTLLNDVAQLKTRLDKARSILNSRQ